MLSTRSTSTRRRLKARRSASAASGAGPVQQCQEVRRRGGSTRGVLLGLKAGSCLSWIAHQAHHPDCGTGRAPQAPAGPWRRRTSEAQGAPAVLAMHVLRLDRSPDAPNMWWSMFASTGRSRTGSGDLADLRRIDDDQRPGRQGIRGGDASSPNLPIAHSASTWGRLCQAQPHGHPSEGGQKQSASRSDDASPSRFPARDRGAITSDGSRARRRTMSLTSRNHRA